MYAVMPASDAMEIFLIDKECFPTEFWSVELIGKDMLHSEYFVLKEDDKTAGYVCVSTVLDEAELTRIAVRNQYRQCGVATKLIEFVKKHLLQRGCKTLILEVRTSNMPARALYSKMGFEVYASRKNYYHNPNEDALLMSLKI